jgi:ferredoxin
MVSVDKEACIGCGACVSIGEKVFEMVDGKAAIIKGQEKSKDPAVKEAIDSCPVNAIKA